MFSTIQLANINIEVEYRKMTNLSVKKRYNITKDYFCNCKGWSEIQFIEELEKIIEQRKSIIREAGL